MELRDALKNLRNELGMTQADLAAALRVNYATVSRWEAGKTYPNRSVSEILLGFARARSISDLCYKNLKETVDASVKAKLSRANGSLYTVEHSSLGDLVEEASSPIYVCDIESDEILYLNKKAAAVFGVEQTEYQGKKCYKCIMQRETPCPFCHKEELTEDRFTSRDMVNPETNTFHRVSGKRIRWNGHNAHIRYITDIEGRVSVTEREERETAYKESLRVRREIAKSALVSAHYNLTKDTVSNIDSSSDYWFKFISGLTLDEVLSRISKRGSFHTNGETNINAIFSRDALIRLYYMGNTHISFKHYIDSSHGFYEGTFDLMQNPTTFDIEAFGTMRDITAETMSRDIVDTLYRLDYEAIAVIDAQTGEIVPFRGTCFEGVNAEQKSVGDNVTGVKNYLQKYCTDDDVDRVILETSLPYVKEQLQIQQSHTVFYSLLQDGKKTHKRSLFAYLDESKKNILCTMQDLSRTFRTERLERDRLSEAVQTLQRFSGVDIARYDLHTRKFFSACKVTPEIGYGEVIDNVPDTFINNGNVAAESIKDFREFFERLRSGETSTTNVSLQIGGGDFHLFRAHGSIIYNEDQTPHQAIIAFQDIDNMRDQSPVYKKLKQIIAGKAADKYKLYRCNLSQGAALGKVEGELSSPYHDTQFTSLTSRTQDYSERYLHPDDRKSYLELMNVTNLQAAYEHGVREMSMDYREKSEDETVYRWRRLHLEMAQYPDCTDIELFLLFQTDL